ncbi:hypothetical protein [Burkholderia thailandensis]|uniref:hypothetical protein n=1 Tax=Burkholderia thailandensis TaxID=57975 RepID=UPI00046D0666|nr:hypothetical protein [Burkholderia thailandensis]AJT48819.1 hypothetical protein DR62_07015 [Burkholderia thailandensis]AOI54029.1 hypothetical protein WI24_19225 [Burkholderia thailandensis]AOJ53015.1 hypothetical protein AQ475_19045 [Burkholderia thailandensis]AVR28871.1 hypothetical protein A8H32_29235 [Burkholderia thailandensis]MCS6425388.1 hypothetical protein [Burkholderia thailandensis]
MKRQPLTKPHENAGLRGNGRVWPVRDGRKRETADASRAERVKKSRSVVHDSAPDNLSPMRIQAAIFCAIAIFFYEIGRVEKRPAAKRMSALGMARDCARKRKAILRR